jgi:hypothetical protein
MNKDDKKVILEFEIHARPVDRVNYIMQKEIITLLKEIRKELKDRD